jgi:hypothetical protein
MLLVLMRICPSCPHAHSRLTTSLSSADWAVDRPLHFLPMATVWLGSPSFWCLAWDLLVRSYTYTVTHAWSIRRNKYVCIFITLAFFTGKVRTYLLLLNPSVKNKKNKYWPRDDNLETGGEVGEETEHAEETSGWASSKQRG